MRGVLRVRLFSSDVHIHHSFGTRGVQYEGGDLLRFAFGLESYFLLPEQGMTQFEILSRGSCFLTPSSDGSRLRVIAPAHVTHPWKFRHRFGSLAKPELDWLDAVREDAVRVVLSAREMVTGRLLAKVPLENGVAHSELDLAVFDMCDEFRNMRLLKQAGVSVLPVELQDDAVENETPIVLVGHEMQNETLLPCWINGQLVGADSDVTAVKTFGGVSQMGLCGGPGLVQGKGEQVRALGMVFARVDAEGPLFNHTILVSSSAIKDFLN
jgi:hypothetical protein